MKSKYVLHEFTMGNVEDLEIYAAWTMRQWQQTPAGKFCMEKATDIHWITVIDHNTLGHRIRIIGTLKDKYATFYALKKGYTWK